jgi:energy-coupling factor transporter ATP-binding protein EcfA2
VPERRNLTLQAENFGPIRQGQVELRPLTVFIGPNNSGKSYAALLLYALSKVLSGRLRGGVQRARFIPSLQQLEKLGRELSRWARMAPPSQKESPSLAALPPAVLQSINESLQSTLSGYKAHVDDALKVYLNREQAQDLVRVGAPKDAFSVRLNPSEETLPLIGLSLSSGGGQFTVKGAVPAIDASAVLPALAPELQRFYRERELEREFLVMGDYGLHTLWQNLLRANGISLFPYYLPAARGGILQSWPILASVAVEVVQRRVGLEEMKLPLFPGAIGDFLRLLLERIVPHPRREVDKALVPALEVLEDKLLQGEILVERARPESGRILYKTAGGLELALQQASSMVGELAPLDLWVKDILVPGDLLIIEEPEAHLHPENQRLVATVLVRLAKAGVRVLCTTHSSLILHQVSNHLLAAEASARTRKALGFNEHDLLSPEDVGVYLFDLQKDGSIIKPIIAEPGFGISEEDFVRVAEAIGDQTYHLSTSRLKAHAPAP